MHCVPFLFATTPYFLTNVNDFGCWRDELWVVNIFQWPYR